MTGSLRFEHLLHAHCQPGYALVDFGSVCWHTLNPDGMSCMTRCCCHAEQLYIKQVWGNANKHLDSSSKHHFCIACCRPQTKCMILVTGIGEQTGSMLSDKHV